jgi:hypothetical protein
MKNISQKFIIIAVIISVGIGMTVLKVVLDKWSAHKKAVVNTLAVHKSCDNFIVSYKKNHVNLEIATYDPKAPSLFISGGIPYFKDDFLKAGVISFMCAEKINDKSTNSITLAVFADLRKDDYTQALSFLEKVFFPDSIEANLRNSLIQQFREVTKSLNSRSYEETVDLINSKEMQLRISTVQASENDDFTLFLMETFHY